LSNVGFPVQKLIVSGRGTEVVPKELSLTTGYLLPKDRGRYLINVFICPKYEQGPYLYLGTYALEESWFN